MNEWMIKVWGGAWNKDASPSIKEDYGIDKGYYYFTEEKAKDKFLEIINNPIYSNQGIARNIEFGELSHKRTIFIGRYEYEGKWFVIHYDLGFEYGDESAEYYFLEGNNSCDCNISSIIRWEYGEDAMPDLDCGDKIKLIAYKVEHWDSNYHKYDGDELIWRLRLDNKV